MLQNNTAGVSSTDQFDWQRLIKNHPDKFRALTVFIDENNLTDPITSPTAQQAFVVMLANCVTDSASMVILIHILSVVLDRVHETVPAEWVELAANVQASLPDDDADGDEATFPDELAEVFKGKHAIESIVVLRSSYILNVLDSATLGPKIGKLRDVARAVKGSALITNHLAACDAALPLDRSAWKDPCVTCLGELSSIESIDEQSLFKVVIKAFPSDGDDSEEPAKDAFQDARPEKRAAQVKAEKTDAPKVAKTTDTRLTFKQICSPPAAVLQEYGKSIATMLHAGSPRSPGTRALADIGFANMFVFAARLQALLYQNIDTPAAKRSYEIVTLDCKAKKPSLVCAGPLLDSLELPFAGHVRIGAIKNKGAMKVCSFMGLDFYVTPPTSGVNCGGCALPVAAWCVPTVKDKDANMEVVRTTVSKRFSVSTWEFISDATPSRKPPLKRKSSGDDDESGLQEVTIEVYLTSLKPKKDIGSEDVRLTVGQTAVNVQSAPVMPKSAMEELLSGIDAEAEQPAQKKQKKQPSGGTWSAKHLLR